MPAASCSRSEDIGFLMLGLVVVGTQGVGVVAHLMQISVRVAQICKGQIMTCCPCQLLHSNIVIIMEDFYKHIGMATWQ